MKYNIIIIIAIIVIIYLISNYELVSIYTNDIIYFCSSMIKKNPTINSNLSIILPKNYSNQKVLIISFDNRTTLNYLEDHNKNILEYTKKFPGIEYKFVNVTDKNVYWVKLYLLRDWIMTNKYDYVMWMDTDAMFVNHSIDLRYVLGMFNSDIFLSHDNDYPFSRKTLNAGVIIIKNSEIGKKFINETLSIFENSKCLNKGTNKLNGLYSLTCYEQGVLNSLLEKKYKDYLTVFSKNIISNTINCKEDVFILHNYGGTISMHELTDIKSCFNKINKKIGIN